jgi:ATP-binding protein involved in chromosome partitioning
MVIQPNSDSSAQGQGGQGQQGQQEQKGQGPLTGQGRPQGVKSVLAVGSGKGGVGKSMVSLNLAVSLAQKGAKVALLDADIHGPSIGMMMGIDASGGVKVENERIIPLEKYGLKVMSIGFILEDDKPVIWRGPLLNKAIEQFLFDVDWGDIDYMIIDLPPGTGDVQLSLAQKIKLSAGIIVTTPQNVALLDAQKAAQMFVQVEVPIMGIVENMSYFVCPHCGHTSHIFSQNGGSKMAEKLDVPLLGNIPLHDSIREGNDSGKPIAYDEGDNEYRKAFFAIADNVMEQAKKYIDADA